MLPRPSQNLRPLACFALITFLVLSLSGCATLGTAIGGLTSLLGQIIGGTFKVIGKTLDLISKLPKPPPGVF